jgi:hypothetical protein
VTQNRRYMYELRRTASQAHRVTKRTLSCRRLRTGHEFGREGKVGLVLHLLPFRRVGDP